MQHEGRGGFDEEIAAFGQDVEGGVGTPMPVPFFGRPSPKCFSTASSNSSGRPCSLAYRSFRNSACAQTSGIALPVGLPGSKPSAGSRPSHTCSGRRPLGPVIRDIVSR